MLCSRFLTRVGSILYHAHLLEKVRSENAALRAEPHLRMLPTRGKFFGVTLCNMRELAKLIALSTTIWQKKLPFWLNIKFNLPKWELTS
jgi:hypothetical protein